MNIMSDGALDVLSTSGISILHTGSGTGAPHTAFRTLIRRMTLTMLSPIIGQKYMRTVAVLPHSIRA